MTGKQPQANTIYTTPFFPLDRDEANKFFENSLEGDGPLFTSNTYSWAQDFEAAIETLIQAMNQRMVGRAGQISSGVHNGEDGYLMSLFLGLPSTEFAISVGVSVYDVPEFLDEDALFGVYLVLAEKMNSLFSTFGFNPALQVDRSGAVPRVIVSDDPDNREQ